MEFITNFLKDLYRSIKRFFQAIKRSYDFAKIGWGNYDWDHGYLFELMLFKLQRMEIALKNGYAEHSKDTLQSLRICIKLLKKIKFRDYFYFTEQHYRKWGPPEIKSVFLYDPEFLNLIRKARESRTEEEREIEKREFLEAINKDDAQEARDRRLLFAIMEKYSRTWWD